MSAQSTIAVSAPRQILPWVAALVLGAGGFGAARYAAPDAQAAQARNAETLAAAKAYTDSEAARCRAEQAAAAERLARKLDDLSETLTGVREAVARLEGRVPPPASLRRP